MSTSFSRAAGKCRDGACLLALAWQVGDCRKWVHLLALAMQEESAEMAPTAASVQERFPTGPASPGTPPPQKAF